MKQLFDFLSEISVNPVLHAQFREQPAVVADQFNLDESEKMIIASGDSQKIANAFQLGQPIHKMDIQYAEFFGN